MALWTDIADWVGPTANKTTGGMSTVVGVVLHIQEGNEQGTEAWQKNPSAQVSSHFLAPKTGRGRQMVDTADKAWAEVAGNLHWLSIECEGWTGQSLTQDQIEFCAQVLAKANRVYHVPLVSTDNPNGTGLGWHGMGGDAWGGHFDCPGDPIKAQRPQIIARAIQIVAGSVMADLDFGTWPRPDSIGNRPAAVLLADLWAQEQAGTSPYPGGSPSARTAQLKQIEAKIDDLAKTVAGLVAAVNKLQTATPWPSPYKVTWTVSAVTNDTANTTTN